MDVTIETCAGHGPGKDAEHPPFRYCRRRYVEALRWYKMADERGDSAAPGNIGFMYRNGHGVPKNYGKAVQYYQKGIKRGNADAVNNLAKLYWTSDAPNFKNHDAAILLWQTTARLGNADAQKELNERRIGW